jgi:hypothetical protein
MILVLVANNDTGSFPGEIENDSFTYSSTTTGYYGDFISQALV